MGKIFKISHQNLSNDHYMLRDNTEGPRIIFTTWQDNIRFFQDFKLLPFLVRFSLMAEPCRTKIFCKNRGRGQVECFNPNLGGIFRDSFCGRGGGGGVRLPLV